MAYIKTDWEDGDVITEAGLDHLENGVYNNSVAIGDLDDLTTTAKDNLVAAINEAAQSGGGGGGSDEMFCVTITDNGSTITSDKTYAQIAAANTAGLFIYALVNGTEYAFDYIDIEDLVAYFYRIGIDSNNVAYRDYIGIGSEGNISGSENTASPALLVPQPLGTAAVGTSARFARENHVHAMPKASQIAAASSEDEVTITSTGAVSQALDAGKAYHFTGAITALTITLNAAAGIPQYHFDFLSGSTAATLTLPNNVTMPDSWAVEANKRYEIDILNGYGVVQEWGTT